MRPSESQFNSIQTRIVNLFSRSDVLYCHSRQEQKGEASIPLGFGRRAMLHPYWVQGDVQSALMDMPVHLEGALTQLSVVNLPQILRGACQYSPFISYCISYCTLGAQYCYYIVRYHAKKDQHRYIIVHGNLSVCTNAISLLITTTTTTTTNYSWRAAAAATAP